MDWTKAKTILIIVFLFTNIFLGYELFELSMGSNYINDTRINEIVDYLKDSNIAVNMDVPHRAKPLPTILVRYKSFSKDEAAAIFFGNSKITDVMQNENSMWLSDGNISVQTRDTNELHYVNKAIAPSNAPNERKSKKAAESFISKMGIGGGGRFFMGETAAGGYYKFSYGQKYSGVPVYNSYIEITANETGVHEARMVWFDSIKDHTNTTEVVSSIGVLLKVQQVLKNSGSNVAVNGMEQGYYFNVTGASSKAVEGTAFPVWKVNTNIAVLYINAYDEKVERMDKVAQ